MFTSNPIDFPVALMFRLRPYHRHPGFGLMDLCPFYCGWIAAPSSAIVTLTHYLPTTRALISIFIQLEPRFG